MLNCFNMLPACVLDKDIIIKTGRTNSILSRYMIHIYMIDRSKDVFCTCVCAALALNTDGIIKTGRTCIGRLNLYQYCTKTV